MTFDNKTMEKKFPKQDKSSNEHIKKFKKSKGAEYVEAVKKRKAEDTGGNFEQKNAKKPRYNNDSKSNFKKPGFKHGKPNHQKPMEKPDWNKMRQETKDKKKRRKQRNIGGEALYDSFSRAIKLWEELRHANCTKSRRLQLCQEVSQLFSGVVKVWIKQAAGVRMAEHLVAYGDEAVRKLLFDEINSKEQILDIMKDSHSQHFLQKMLRHGNKEQRQAIIAAAEGQVVRLTKHSIACQVIELAYSDFANAAQRSTMMQEFFGPRFKYFKEDDVKSLADVLKKYPSKKEAVMKDLQKGLQAIMHKGIFNNSLILSLLREYLMFCEHAEKQTVIESLEDGLLPVIHTRDGSRIAMMCLWSGSSKQRKTILKSFRDHMLEVATWDHSYMVLLAAMDCVDDTKLLGKAVLDVLMKESSKLLDSEIGTRVFRYMILGRNPTYFHPDILDVLKQGDGNPQSKKDPETRRQEIVAHVSKGLLDTILRNLEYWCRNQQWTLFLGPAIAALATAEHKTTAMEALAKHCAEIMPPDVNRLVDIAQSSKMLNYVVGKDVENKKNKMPIFSLLLLKYAQKNLVQWLDCNRGCFLCVRLLETGIGRVIVATRELLADHISKIEKIKDSAKGAQILLQKLKETEDIDESEVEEENDEMTQDDTMDEGPENEGDESTNDIDQEQEENRQEEDEGEEEEEKESDDDEITIKNAGTSNDFSEDESDDED